MDGTDAKHKTPNMLGFLDVVIRQFGKPQRKILRFRHLL
jgi:hypothetical protein